MEWLNYHHLRYFWVTAREGSLAKAAETLRVSQPSISEQIHELEFFIGEKLFRKEGRTNKLTEAGDVIFGYADAIFSLGSEMLGALKQRPSSKTLRLNVGALGKSHGMCWGLWNGGLNSKPSHLRQIVVIAVLRMPEQRRYRLPTRCGRNALQGTRDGQPHHG
jgi:hypothetical protein